MAGENLKNNKQFHWLIKLGLKEQAMIYCGEPTLQFDIICFGTGILTGVLWYVVDDYEFHVQHTDIFYGNQNE